MEYLTFKDLDLTVQEKIQQYYELLKEWNHKFNLTRLTTSQYFFDIQIPTCLLLANVVNLENQTVADIGTGGGLPGIILKIVFSDLNIMLIEPNKKKCEFLNHVISELKLKKIKVINDRAEIVVKMYRHYFDVVVAQAVAPLPILLELAMPLLSIDGKFVAYKSQRLSDELKTSKVMIKSLKTKLVEIKKFQVEDNIRQLAVFELIDMISLKYPRPYTKIKSDYKKYNDLKPKENSSKMKT